MQMSKAELRCHQQPPAKNREDAAMAACAAAAVAVAGWAAEPAAGVGVVLAVAGAAAAAAVKDAVTLIRMTTRWALLIAITSTGDEVGPMRSKTAPRRSLRLPKTQQAADALKTAVAVVGVGDAAADVADAVKVVEILKLMLRLWAPLIAITSTGDGAGPMTRSKTAPRQNLRLVESLQAGDALRIA